MSSPKDQYLQHFLQMAVALYRLGDGRDGSTEWIREQTRLRGYAEAGRVIGLVSSKEIQDAIDRAHVKVLGETRQQRRSRVGGPHGINSQEIDWELLDKPAYERRR